MTSLTDATLNQEQLSEVANKIKTKCPEYSMDSIKQFVRERDCLSNELGSGASWILHFSTGTHTYGCSQSIHYLNDEVISILSSKTEVHNTQITDSNIMSNVSIIDSTVSQSIDNSKTTVITNFFIKFLTVITDINFYLGITLTIVVSIIYKWLLKLNLFRKKTK